MSNTELSLRARRAQRFENFAHYLAALVLILKGIDKIENPEKVPYGFIFLALGLILILGTIFHHKAENVLKHFKIYVFLIEFIAISIVGYLYMKDGKQFIQYVCFFTAIMFLVAAVIYIRKSRSKSAG